MPSGAKRSIRYVALGDSYTIGTAVRTAGERWPDQLVARLVAGGVVVELVGNLGVNGFTSRDVIEVELPRFAELEPDFATLLIGVNDVVQDVPASTYSENVEHILNTLLAELPPNRLVAVSTPDYTVTPQGAAYGEPATQSAAIRRNNEILAEAAAARGIAHVDIFDLSLAAAADRTLVADDGLHPSAAQYSRWVDRIEPVVAALLAS